MSDSSQLSSSCHTAGEAVLSGSDGDATKTDSSINHLPIRPQESRGAGESNVVCVSESTSQVELCPFGEGEKSSSSSSTGPVVHAPSTAMEQEAELRNREAQAINEKGGTEPAEDARPRLCREVHEPTPEVRRAHEAAGHVPYRPWCQSCVEAMKADLPHASSGGMRVKSDIPELHCDYCFSSSSNCLLASTLS